MKLSQDEKVKGDVVQLIAMAKDKKDFYHAALLVNAYTKLRHVELKLDEGQWGSELDPVMPAERPVAPS